MHLSSQVHKLDVSGSGPSGKPFFFWGGGGGGEGCSGPTSQGGEVNPSH